jgi:hypothetical protein
MDFCRVQWTSISKIVPLDLTARPTNADDEAPHLIAQLQLEITLTREVPPDDNQNFTQRPTINRDHLTNDAFRPKLFTVKIKDGYFATPVSLLHLSTTGAHGKDWTKRLVSDNSPIPPASEWKEDACRGACDPEGTNCWDCKGFVA